ncbi:hypothetical protein ACJMK2_008721 [Sinanodonta woodiana]|uniref:TNFR-Cys domain-containing protein n=1 Tax=Sinanodonta woodiana TaxID=1069815 RepID=A0ABD3VP07_SINWO
MANSASAPARCWKTLESCPAGHEMEKCTLADQSSGFYCKQCGQLSFQPNENRWGDQCRLRRVCTKMYMKYKELGSNIKDAVCECDTGYHFENIDQRACVPNKICPKGFGQGPYGVCENCLAKDMWSDSVDQYETCKPLRNCAKENRCVIEKSNGTKDNRCGPVVKDITDCDSIIYEQQEASKSIDTHTIIGAVLGSVFFVAIIIIIVILCIRRRKRSRRKRHLTKEQLDETLEHMLKRSRKDELYCKKALTMSQKEIEDRIDRQIWTLAQELFRNHPQPAKYEVTVEKYKGSQHKFAVNGYLQDWRVWKGDTAEALEHVINCLKQCKREDIVYEICSKVHQEDFPIVVTYATAKNRSTSKPNVFSRFLGTVNPCSKSNSTHIDDNIESKETSSKLLEANQTSSDTRDLTVPLPEKDLSTAEAGAIYRERKTPSAPVFVDVSFIPEPETYKRSTSSPAQSQ